MNKFFLLLLILVPTLVLADPYDANAITQSTFFSMAPSDESLQMLAILFGDVGGLLPTSNYTVVGAMFGVFNQTVLVLGTIVMFYTLVISTINTAQEGEVMGKKWSSTWIPLRTISGVGLLIPMATGYSMIQVLTMWVVVQGAGAADLMWDTVTTYYKQAAELSGPQAAQLPVSVDSSDQFMSDLTYSVTCELFFDAWSRNKLDTNTSLCCLRSRWEFHRGSFFWWDDWIKWVETNQNGNPIQIQSTTYYYDDPNNPTSTQQAHQNICGTFTFNVSQVVDPKSGQNLLTDSDMQAIAQAQRNGWWAAYNVIRGVMQPAMEQARNDSQSAASSASPTSVYGPTYDDIKAAITTYIMNSGNGPLTDATNAYNAQLSAVIPQLSAMQAPPSGDSWEDLATERGWMDAGGWYFYLANSLQSSPVIQAVEQQPSKTQPGTADTNTAAEWDGLGAGYYEDACNDMRPSPNWTPARDVLVCDDGGTQTYNWTSDVGSPYAHGYWNFSIVYAQMRSAAAQSMLDNGTYSGSEWLRLTSDLPQDSNTSSYFRTGIFALGNGIVEFVINIINNGQTPEDQLANDPIVNISAAGHKLLVDMEAAFIAAAIWVMAAAAIAGIPWLGLANSVTEAIIAVVLFVGPLMMSFMLMIWGAAATMAYYLPMIPYILFIFGSLGWIVGVLESMVAAPLVALGLVVPAQDELGRAGHAIMLVTNIFLRPTLMIVGLVCAVFMVRIGVFLLNETFMAVLYVNAGGVTLFGSFMVLGLYFSLLMGMVQKSFALIHEIPDKVLRWIGHQGQEQFGEAQGLQKAEQSFDSNAGKAGKQAEGFGKGIMARGEQNRIAGQERAAQKGSGGGNNSISTSK